MWIKITVDKVIIQDNDYKQVICQYRLYGDKKESMNWLPYLNLMSKFPNALKYTDLYSEIPLSLKTYSN